MTHRPFHLAIPVNDIASARAFYGDVLDCREGRSSDQWIDFDLVGHQLVTHLVPGYQGAAAGMNGVDGHDVPVPHFGVVLTLDQFDALAARVAAAGVTFIHPPMTRFAGDVGEQRTMFFADPAGNALEFKAFADDAQLFATS
jgi:uncharacterized protein